MLFEFLMNIAIEVDTSTCQVIGGKFLSNHWALGLDTQSNFSSKPIVSSTIASPKY